MPTNPNDEVKEMNDVFDEILDKTDEEIQQKAEEDAEKSDEPGEANKDLTPEADPEPTEEDPNKPKDDPGKTPDTTLEVDALKAKVAELEDQLKKERQRTGSWDGRIKAANTRVAELEAELKAIKEADPVVADPDNKTEAEIMAAFQETFPEFTEVLGIIQKKIDAKAATPTPDKVKPEIDAEPVAEKKEKTSKAQTEHMKTIRKAHPAIDEMVSTGVILTWINMQPDFISSHLKNIYDSGSSDDVIKMVNEFTAKTGWISSLTKGKAKKDKLASMLETDGGSSGPVNTEGPDKNDFEKGAKDAGL